MTISTQTTNYVLNNYLSSLIEATAVQDMIALLFAKQLNIPENSGNVLLVTRFENLPPAVEAVQPGSPSGNVVTLQRTILPTAINLYTQQIYLDTRFVMQDELPWLSAAAERLAVSLREGQDLLTYQALNANASAYSCRFGASADFPTEISGPDMQNVYVALRLAAAPFITQGKAGDLQFNTQPVSASYFALANQMLISSLMAISGFQQAISYPIKSDERSPAEFGSLPPGFRFWTSGNVPFEANASELGSTVLNTFVGGGLPYCGVALGSNSLETIYRPPEYSNPAGLQVSIAAKAYFGSSVLQDTWILNVRSTSTYQPI